MVGSVELSGEHVVDFGDIGRTPFEIRQDLAQMQAFLNPVDGIEAWKTKTTSAISKYKTDAISGITSGKLPDLQIQPLSHVIRAIGIGDFKAIAHTDGEYTVQKVSGSLAIKGDNALTKTIAVPVLDLPSTKKPVIELVSETPIDKVEKVSGEVTKSAQAPVTTNKSETPKPLTNLSVRRFGIGNGFTVRYLNKRL